ncbi:MAG: MOSC domain-containing protein [Gammaproteobacteria bacterium]
MHVESLHFYPVKSIAAVDVARAAVEPRGLTGDRRYLLIDENGRFMTGRENPQLVQVRATPTPTGLVIEAPGQSHLEIEAPRATAPAIDVRIWRDDVQARGVSAAADAWFTAFLGKTCRLVFQHDDDIRVVAAARQTTTDDLVSFADGYPVLLIGTASLDDLNARLTDAVTMAHFRTNIVARTETAFIEDDWERIRIGDIHFDVAKRCARCVFTTVDLVTGERRADGEPLKALRGYRLDRSAPGVMFGVNLIPRDSGFIEQGSPIELVA